MKKSKRFKFLLIPFSLFLSSTALLSSCKEPEKNLQKEINEALTRITIDYENKKNILIKDIDKNKIIFRNLNQKKYDLIIKKIENTKETLAVTFLLKSKTNNLISKETTLIISGFKKENTTPNPNLDLQKELDDLAESLMTKYDDDANKIDANEVELNKIILTKNDGSLLDPTYQIKDKKFVNENATNDDIYNGVREFTFKLAKNNLESVEIKTSITVHKSAKALQDLRASLKSRWQINNSYAAKETLEKLTDGSILHLNYKTGEIYDKPFSDVTKKLLFKAKTWNESEFDTLVSNGNIDNYKADRSKLIFKKTSNKYWFTFKIGIAISHTKVDTWRIDYKDTSVNEMELSLPTSEDIEAKANEIKNLFDYPNKQNIELGNIIESNIQMPNLPDKYEIKKIEIKKDFANNKLIVKYSVIYTDDDNITKSSKKYNAEISGFKQDELGEEFKDLKVDYENKESTLPSEITNLDKLKLTKNNSPYTPKSEIELKKEIIFKNDTLGTLEVKITLKKYDKELSQTFIIDGFKQKAFDLQNLVNRLIIGLTSSVNKQTTLPSMVNEDNITVEDPDKQLQILNNVIVEKTLTPIDNEGKLKVKVTVKYNGNQYSKEVEISGFLISATSIKDELRNEGNNLFDKLDASEIAKLEQIWKDMTSSQQNKGIYLNDKNFKYGKLSSQLKKEPLKFKFKNDKFNKSSQYKETLFKSIINPTYTAQKGVIKALYIKKDNNGKFYVEYKLLDEKTKEAAKKHTTIYKWEMQ